MATGVSCTLDTAGEAASKFSLREGDDVKVLRGGKFESATVVDGSCLAHGYGTLLPTISVRLGGDDVNVIFIPHDECIAVPVRPTC